MGLCGCFPSCPCQLSAGNDLVLVSGDGDPTSDPPGWIVSGVETPFSLTNVDGAIEITPGGSYGHSPVANMRLEDTDTISLLATPTGLQANLINAPGEGGGVPTGAFFPWLTNVAPSGYLMMTGPNAAGFVDIVDQPALFAVIDHVGTGYVDPADGTFKIPDPADTFLIGQGLLGGLGTLGGVAAVTLSIAQIPAHDHAITDPGHNHTGTTGSDGDHAHGTSTAGRLFVEAESATAQQVRVAQDGGVTTPNRVDVVADTNDGNADFGQKSDAQTDISPTHNHAIPSAATGIDVLNEGGGGSHTNMPPYFVTNFIIKV